MLFRQIYDDSLAQYAYLVACQRTNEALIVDPERDVDQYIDLAEEEGFTIVAVAETHIHADFLSGARELAERLGAKLYLSDEGDEHWKYEWVKQGAYDYTLLRHGDAFTVGLIEITALHTPGHTPEHLSFLVTDRGAGADAPMGILTGDFVFVGDLGRPDLLESAAKMVNVMKPSARRLYHSVQQFLTLQDFLQVWPAHGAGSVCGKALGAVPQSTVGYEKRYSPAIDAARQGEEAFVAFILEGQPEPPLYFARMKRDNKLGVPLLHELPRPQRLTMKELGDVVHQQDAVIVDTRADRSAFMAKHLPRSLFAPLDKRFSTAVGSLVEDETAPVYLIISEERLEEAVRALVRIGYDDMAGYVEPEMLARYFIEGGEYEAIEEIDFDRLEAMREREGIQVIDVRYASEYKASHVPGAINASYTRLPEYQDRLSGDATLLVHCASGARSAIAAAYLARTGRKVRYVNGRFEDWKEAHQDAVQEKMPA